MNNQRQESSEPVKLWILHDRSGSMAGLERGLVAGTNKLLDDQRSLPGRCRVTIAQFDSIKPLRIAVDARRIQRIRPMTLRDFEPRGQTPLLDAIGGLIRRADQRIADRQRRGRRSEDQTAVVITDGYENSSTDFGWERVHEMISQRIAQGWTIALLGANQDSYAVGERLGIPRGNISDWPASEEGLRRANESVSRALKVRRTMGREERAATRDDFFGGVREAEEVDAS